MSTGSKILASSGSKRFTLSDFREAASKRRESDGPSLAMLTCYDFTTAKLLDDAGMKLILVGDSAANVILGHDSTLPVPLDFMIQITAAVRRGAPRALVMADMPFGTCTSTAVGLRNVVKMVQLSGCDCVKIECTQGHMGLVQSLADSGVAVFAHLGLTPQSIGLLGSYKAQGRTAEEAMGLVDLANDLWNAGAAGVLFEATPPQVASLAVAQLDIPIIGCGAGENCDAHVVVLHDVLGLTERSPRFAPRMGEMGPIIEKVVKRYMKSIESLKYPANEHLYQMTAVEIEKLTLQALAMDIEL